MGLVALERVYDEYAPTVLGYLINVIGDRGVAEDVHQQVFLEVWQRAPGYEPERVHAEHERRIVDMTLTGGLTGISRFLFRQRFLATRFYRASLELRGEDRAAARRYLLESLACWPSPFLLPQRWWALCLTLAGRV